jgi:hypothetical protein
LGEPVAAKVGEVAPRVNAASAIEGDDAQAAQTVARRLEEARANLQEAAKAAGAAAGSAGNSDAAKAALARIQQAQQRVAQFAQQAQQAASALQQAEDASARALSDADRSQTAVDDRAVAAANTIQRGTRHEARLNPAKSYEMLNVGLTVDGLARATLPDAHREIMAAADPGAAETTAREAKEAIDASARVVMNALGQGGDEGKQQQKGPSDPNAKKQAQAKARALDQLDSQMNQGQQKGSQPQKADAKQASKMMSQAQQDATRAERNQPPSDAEAQSAEGYYSAAGKAAGALPQLQGAQNNDWGKLRAQMARDLNDGRRDAQGGEYRAMIDAYFRVIAEQARKAER